MKTIQKIVVILSAVLIFYGYIYSQESKYIPKESLVKKAYEICSVSLNSEIQGIVETSIYNVILIKKYYPSAKYSSIIDKLNEIAEENIDPSIRFKAHLASVYLNFSDIISIEPAFNIYDREYIFKQITAQLEKNLLVSN